MKIGVISDIHGNSIALQAVLEDMPNVDSILCLGDIVGYGPNPSQCVELVRKNTTSSLKGNHEMYLYTPSKADHNHAAYQGILHAKDVLTPDQLKWARDRPQSTTVDDTLLIAHGHPNSKNPYDYVLPENVTELVPYFDGNALMATGHSHHQFKQDLSKFPGDGGLYFNPGSVGQPRDGDPKAAYAVVDTETTAVDLRRTEYDIKSAQERFRQTELPEISAKRLENGK